MKKVFKKVSFMLLATWSIQLDNFLGFFGMGQKTNSTTMQPTQKLSDNPVNLDSSSLRLHHQVIWYIEYLREIISAGDQVNGWCTLPFFCNLSIMGPSKTK